MFRRRLSIDEKALRNSFKKIKEELDDHLTAINDNTDEIQKVYEYIQNVEDKIEKLNEKIEQVQLSLSKYGLYNGVEKIVDLTSREQEFFLLLYTDKDFLTYREISEKLNLREEYVEKMVYSLIKKGIPIIRKQQNNTEMIKLDDHFRELQTRSQVVDINEQMSKQFTKDFGAYTKNNKKITDFNVEKINLKKRGKNFRFL